MFLDSLFILIFSMCNFPIFYTLILKSVGEEDFPLFIASSSHKPASPRPPDTEGQV